eukprot:GHUV01046751.1.p1 GENE.GHUV01046751.1~~GHUV01046751.1.p1  ORF type:complete len:186 (+),score=15.98 GHUV01046751.1:97-654(+)
MIIEGLCGCMDGVFYTYTSHAVNVRLKKQAEANLINQDVSQSFSLPAPKGKNWNLCCFTSFSGLKREGSNVSGSLQICGERPSAYVLMNTTSPASKHSSGDYCRCLVGECWIRGCCADGTRPHRPTALATGPSCILCRTLVNRVSCWQHIISCCLTREHRDGGVQPQGLFAAGLHKEVKSTSQDS